MWRYFKADNHLRSLSVGSSPKITSQHSVGYQSYQNLIQKKILGPKHLPGQNAVLTSQNVVVIKFLDRTTASLCNLYEAFLNHEMTPQNLNNRAVYFCNKFYPATKFPFLLLVFSKKHLRSETTQRNALEKFVIEHLFRRTRRTMLVINTMYPACDKRSMTTQTASFMETNARLEEIPTCTTSAFTLRGGGGRTVATTHVSARWWCASQLGARWRSRSSVERR